MRISSLQQQKRRRDRVSVFLDEEFWVGISERLCSELALVVGMEIDRDRKREIEAAALEDGALQYAFDRLSRGILPVAQLEKKLREKGFSPQTTSGVIKRCQELGLLDDLLWAETVSEDRRDRGQGRRKVDSFLQQKGIDAETRERALQEAFADDDEAARARDVIRDRYQIPLNPPDQRRAYTLLLRRGFSGNTCSDAVTSFSMNEEDAENAWGWEEALKLIQSRFDEETPQNKVWSYLRRRSFSPGAIKRALDNFYS